MPDAGAWGQQRTRTRSHDATHTHETPASGVPAPGGRRTRATGQRHRQSQPAGRQPSESPSETVVFCGRRGGKTRARSKLDRPRIALGRFREVEWVRAFRKEKGSSRCCDIAVPCSRGDGRKRRPPTAPRSHRMPEPSAGAVLAPLRYARWQIAAPAPLPRARACAPLGCRRLLPLPHPHRTRAGSPQ